MGCRTITEYEALGIPDTNEEKAAHTEEKDARRVIDDPASAIKMISRVIQGLIN